ncbi:YciI family protein [Flavobacterium humi]|uniref:Transcription initiation protein n=1 Tax=Flavobacterium humi TaxID=2562683 RepID=A0A4Z0L3S7_9FLAO|nr:transcription initiation protein [Flavobacterium humi]TGD56578.1 transcription initiation protein [Flavobacterium humi]
MSRFLILIHDDPAGRQEFLSPEEMQTAIQLFREWISRIAVKDKLMNLPGIWDLESCLIRQNPEFPKELDSEMRPSIGGMFLMKAGNYQEAAAIAKECPALQYGAVIEVRMAIE